MAQFHVSNIFFFTFNIKEVCVYVVKKGSYNFDIVPTSGDLICGGIGTI
jgi:hypothetical protein